MSHLVESRPLDFASLERVIPTLALYPVAPDFTVYSSEGRLVRVGEFRLVDEEARASPEGMPAAAIGILPEAIEREDLRTRLDLLSLAAGFVRLDSNPAGNPSEIQIIEDRTGLRECPASCWSRARRRAIA